MLSSASLTIILGCIISLAAAGVFDNFTVHALSPDNTCGRNGTAGGGADGYMCPPDLPCCSVNGFCGAENAYCLTTAGCQADFGNCTAPTNGTITPDFTCGITGAGQYGYSCSLNKPCCSVNGWCGNSSDYCSAAAGCQSAYGTCESAAGSNPGAGGTSANGQCGPGLGACASNECCSLAGFCGTTPDYCNAPDCQFNYGPACDANKIPSGSNTSSIARQPIGRVPYASDGIYDCSVAGDVALTFDDGPFIYTSHVLDLLAQYNATATFFVTGINNGKGAIDNNSLPWPGLIKRMDSAGHQIASHTWSHADLCNISSSQRKDEMIKNEMAIRNILGKFPTYMRPPYTSCTAECGCEADLEELGYHITYFDLDTQDYLNDSPTLIQNSKNIFDAAFQGKSPDRDEFLVIGHDIHNQTANVLVEYMLKSIQANGFRPVTVGDCLGDPKANWYRTDTETTLG